VKQVGYRSADKSLKYYDFEENGVKKIEQFRENNNFKDN
jgi:hypothetical protein